MPATEFDCLPTMIGSMPHTDPAPACTTVKHYLKDIPAWPQLPRRSALENMYVQYSEGFPGVVLKEGSIHVNRARGTEYLEPLYNAYLANDFSKYPISAGYAAGLHHCLGDHSMSVRAVKGQITGPVTWGLTVTDETGRPIIYEDIMGDAVARFIRLKARWQENELRRVSPNTVIFLDEPYMSAFGSSSVMLSREKVVSLLDEVFSGLTGLKGIHCCGNTDWSLLLATGTNIISFDTYSYAQSLSLYPAEVAQFLNARKGGIAWGIVPNEAEALAKETVASLKDRLEEAMAPFTRNGVRFATLVRQGLLTPCCGLAGLTPEIAEHALSLLADLSIKMRQAYLT